MPDDPTPGKVALRGELLARYLANVRRLPPKFYDVYIQSEFESAPSEEIARRLALPVSAVETRLRRARVMLHEELRRGRS